MPTIYDVAELAGFSISTVSRVLNSPERVDEETRAKVLLAISQLEYVPKAEARARALQSTRRIGVLTPFFTEPSFVQRLRGIAAALSKTNYELVIYTVESLKHLKGYLISLPLTGNLDGMIIMSMPIEESETKWLSEHKIEIVTIEYQQDCFSGVEINDFAGGKLAARYLAGKGHRRLAFLGDLDPPDYAIRPVVARFKGYKQGLAEYNIHLPDTAVRSSPSNQDLSRHAARELLSQRERPSAIFAAMDVHALAVMQVSREMGLKNPEDLAVLGFDDLDMAGFVGLTTIRQPLDDSGRIAAELLLARLANPGRQVQHVQLPLSLVERDTV